mgnify:CR=1 FL=1
MDALKVIAQDSLKTGDEIPQIKIGDTVKVSVKIREGERERIQVLKEPLLPARVRAFPRPSPFAEFPTVSASRESSRYIHPTLLRLSSSEAVRSAEASSITSETESVRPQELRARSNNCANEGVTFICYTFFHFKRGLQGNAQSRGILVQI